MGQNLHEGLRSLSRCRSRRRVLVYVLPVVAVLVASCGGNSAVAEHKTPSVGQVAIDAYSLPTGQTVLVNGAGHALYMFVPDAQKSVTCSIVCLRSWPLVSVPAGTKPKVGSKVEPALVGTIKASVLTSDQEAVTYNRWPLYTYADDISPHMTSGEGTDLNGGYWYLMQTNGVPVVPSGDPAP
jgi:predicted lipoprotein with Yx(FWY)xxD motif